MQKFELVACLNENNVAFEECNDLCALLILPVHYSAIKSPCAYKSHDTMISPKAHAT